ncbi:hypothetical protein JB92DRAFT_2967758 [Gautieria morchelliformis]|nr:hypothetical protein JB92DRAFT_2967758 [Gautieria morchelliformis]
MGLCPPPVNIESGFFYFKCPQSSEDVQSFRDRLRAYKYASFKAPLQPGHVLVVTSYMRSYHDPPSSGTRELPPLIQKGTGHAMTMPQLLLETPIRVGEELWSQVWKGTMTSGDLPDVPSAPVVIKLFQESHFRNIWPTINDFWGDLERALWVPGARLAANEAWAFDRMRALHGRGVPWSYGFCKCVLPNGEWTFGHVMELVNGPTLDMKTADELGLDDTGIFNLADSLFLTIYEMHECGIIHKDIKEDNVIILFDPSNQHCDAVLLDFAMCTTLGPPSRMKMMIQMEIKHIGGLLNKLGVKERGVPWLQFRLQSNHPYVEVLASLDRLNWLRPLPEYLPRNAVW